VALGDQPGITAEVVSQLIQSFRAARRGIVVPTYQGRRGHPLLIAMRFRDEILSRFDTVGLRGLLESHPDEVVPLEVEQLVQRKLGVARVRGRNEQEQ
jgi:molybdenum cofactor cytidylyltransferase